MKTAKEVVSALTIRELIQLVHEYEEFERTCFTGDTLLRRKTIEFAGDNDALVIVKMMCIAMEAYRVLAIPCINEFDKKILIEKHMAKFVKPPMVKVTS